MCIINSKITKRYAYNYYSQIDKNDGDQIHNVSDVYLNIL